MSRNTTQIHIEVLQKRLSYSTKDIIKCLVDQWIQSNYDFDSIHKKIDESNGCLVIDKLSSHLSSDVESINISVSTQLVDNSEYVCGVSAVSGVSAGDYGIDMNKSNITDNNIKYYIYQLNYDSIGLEQMESNDEQLPSAQHLILPCFELNGLWESLIYDNNVKQQLLSFALTSLLFADRKVNNKLISWNKVILLHGPPGTGKTSLCRALAHKLSIRLSDRYQCSQLIEINSHSLFSKWFSESGKLVMKLFEKIKEYVEYGDQLIFVLIDEVESLAHSRSVTANSSEPSDSIRVVNALLTQIDYIKTYANVIILTTSNMTEAIDLAFVDRTDIKQYIGFPSVEAIYQIYKSCIQELVRSNIVMCDESLLSYNQLKSMTEYSNKLETTFAGSYKLLEISTESISLSGRTLRKIPFLAVALFCCGQIPIKFSNFLDYLAKSVRKQFEDKKEIKT